MQTLGNHYHTKKSWQFADDKEKQSVIIMTGHGIKTKKKKRKLLDKTLRPQLGCLGLTCFLHCKWLCIPARNKY